MCLICQLWFVKEEFGSLNQILLGNRLELLNACSFNDNKKSLLMRNSSAKFQSECLTSVTFVSLCESMEILAPFRTRLLWSTHYWKQGQRAGTMCSRPFPVFQYVIKYINIKHSFPLDKQLSMVSKLYIRTFMNWKNNESHSSDP